MSVVRSVAELSKLTLSKLGALIKFPRTFSSFARLLGILLLVLNIKSLPLMWHGRFYAALYHHLFRKKLNHPTPDHLFAPIATRSRPTLYECDVNLHKSNSTYFSDLDINRTHLIVHLIKRSLQQRRASSGKSMYVALAGVTALFRREIKPYEKYEVRSRLLAWDGKWLFVVSHFVRPGSGDESKRIFSSALSKYVFKEGRKTVPPEEVLLESGLLPPRPEGILPVDSSTPSGASGSDTPLDLSSSTPDLVHISASNLSIGSGGHKYDDVLDKVLEKSFLANSGLDSTATSDGWTWQRIEKERRRGLEIAKLMLGLDSLDDELRDCHQWGKLY